MQATTASRGVSIFFIAFALLFIGVGGWLARSQQQRITTYRPVEAVILSSRIESHRGSKSTTYRPVVQYRYTVGNQAYECNTVLPLSMSSGYGWAQSIVARFPAGQHTTAYYNPANPSEAFLDRRYSFFPYIFILFPMVFVAVGLALLLAGGRTSLATAAPLRDGWFELHPTTRLVDRRRAAGVVAGVWVAVGTLTTGHYFLAAAKPYETMALVATGIYGALAMIPLGLFTRYTLLSHEIGDATVTINTATIVNGQAFKIRAVQPVRENLQVQELILGILCEETTQTYHNGKRSSTTRTCYEDKLSVVGNNYARAGENITAVTQLTAPVGQPASSPPDWKDYPRYAWYVTVNTRLANSPDYQAKFRVTIG